MPRMTVNEVIPFVKTGGSTRVDLALPASFKVGDLVRAKNLNPPGHIRLPRYIRGKVGIVTLSHGVFITPDTSAHGLGDHPQHVYTVAFSASEVVGVKAAPNDHIMVDLWDNYMELM